MASQHTEQKKVPIYFRVIGEGLLHAESRSKLLPCECLLLRIILELVRFRNLL